MNWQNRSNQIYKNLVDYLFNLKGLFLKATLKNTNILSLGSTWNTLKFLLQEIKPVFGNKFYSTSLPMIHYMHVLKYTEVYLMI